jgi:valyl-tRNA synthetase
LLHPFLPFITEEIYHLLQERKDGDDICIRQYHNDASLIDEDILFAGELAKNGITTIRDLRIKLSLKSKDIIYPKIKTNTPDKYKIIEPVILRMTSSGSIDYVTVSLPQTFGAISGSDMIYLPLTTSTTTTTTINILEEQKKKLEEELEHHKKFLELVEKKLSNQRFIQNAKSDVINLERKKKLDIEDKINTILLALKSN